MKKVLSLLFLLTIILFSANKTNAMSYEEASNDSKPMALLVYASWADDIDKVKQTFDALSQRYDKKYNFVTLDIASSDTKAFNKKYHIYPNLPYVLLFKDRGKISRYLQKDCAQDNSCFAQKLDMFAN